MRCIVSSNCLRGHHLGLPGIMDSPRSRETLTTRQQKAQTPLSRAAVRTFAANERMNQLVIENLDPAAWNAKLAAKPSGQVRTIAAIFTHVHNIRTKWIRLTAPHLKIPSQLKRSQC